MSKIRTIYNAEDLYVGPAVGVLPYFLNDSYFLQRIDRVKSFSWSVNAERTQILELGRRETAAEPVLKNSVDFSFDYCSKNVANEARVGMNVNFNTGVSPYYNNNFSPFIFSGFVNENRNLDARNFYLAVNAGYEDTHTIYTGDSFANSGSGLLSFLADPKGSGYYVMAFANSYLKSYRFDANVGDFPHASLNYVAESLLVSQSGYNFVLPSWNVKSGKFINNKTGVYLQRDVDQRQPSVLLPGDVSLSLTANSGNIQLPIEYTDFKPNGFSLEIELPRREIEALGYFSVIDRPITFPIFASVTFDGIVGDLKSGNIADLFSNDQSYTLAVTIRNPLVGATQGTAVRWDIRGAKFNGLSSNDTIGQNKTATLSFKTELSQNLNSGVFLSGIAFGSILNCFMQLEQSGGYYHTAENGNVKISEGFEWGPNVF